jgi:hypothetical protein
MASNQQSEITKHHTINKRYAKGDFETVWEEFGDLSIKYKTVNLGSGFPNYQSLTYLNEKIREVVDEVSPFAHQYTRPHVYDLFAAS